MPTVKAQPIRLFILDVDGVLTDGRIYYGPQGADMRGFHIHDGLGIKLLQKAGIPVAVISGKSSPSTINRLTDLNIQHMYLGNADKLPAYMDLKQRLNVTDEVIAYMGDDLPDLPLLRRVGLSITVPEAPDVIKRHVDFVTKRKAGYGAVREACELILNAQHQYEPIIETYLQ